MLFTLYELALNPEIQTKVRQEIRKALQKHGEITYEMMIDIPYLDQVINGKLSNIHVLPKHKSKNQFHFFNLISYKKTYRNLENVSTIHNSCTNGRKRLQNSRYHYCTQKRRTHFYTRLCDTCKWKQEYNSEHGIKNSKK